jgi:hypothetical protein
MEVFHTLVRELILQLQHLPNQNLTVYLSMYGQEPIPCNSAITSGDKVIFTEHRFNQTVIDYFGSGGSEDGKTEVG